MNINDLRASHLPNVGDRVTVTRADGAEFIVTRESDQEGLFYRVRPVVGLADFSASHLSATAKSLREIVREAKGATVRDEVPQHTAEELAQHEHTLREFPGFETVLPVIPGMENWSWHNDTTPKLGAETHDGYRAELTCDFIDPDKREEPESDHPLWLLCALAPDDEVLLNHPSDTCPDDVMGLAMRAINNHRALAMRERIAEASRLDDTRNGFKLPLSRAAFLATRQQVDGVCAAMGVSPDDGVVEECLDGTDLPGWTYVDGHGSDVYIVQYPDGIIGAEFGGMQVHAATLEEAENQLCDILDITGATEVISVRAVSESKLSTAGAHAALTVIYHSWLREQGHPLDGCAYELLVAGQWADGNRLTAEQRAFAAAFNNAWDAA